MKTQKQIDDLIEQIRTAEEKESVTNEMEADVLEFLNEKTKPFDKKHEVMSEEEYSRNLILSIIRMKWRNRTCL